MSALEKSRGHLRSSTNVRVYAVTINPSASVRAIETISRGHGTSIRAIVFIYNIKKKTIMSVLRSQISYVLLLLCSL